jgi:hypothetical protein
MVKPVAETTVFVVLGVLHLLEEDVEWVAGVFRSGEAARAAASERLQASTLARAKAEDWHTRHRSEVPDAGGLARLHVSGARARGVAPHAAALEAVLREERAHAAFVALNGPAPETEADDFKVVPVPLDRWGGWGGRSIKEDADVQ